MGIYDARKVQRSRIKKGNMIDKEIITSYLNSGISVIPVWGDNATDEKSKKAPAIPGWIALQTKMIDIPDIDKMFNKSGSIGAIGGKVSGGLEIIDFDNHDGDASDRFRQFCTIIRSLIDSYDIPYEKTVSGGYHLFFRSDKSAGNQKLAVKLIAGKRDTIIETRGEGGYVVCSPSKGYILKHGSLTNIPRVTNDERDYIIKLCKSFNEIEENTTDGATKYPQMGDRRPGDEYNTSDRGSEEAKALLKHAGWKNTYGVYWVRPDKSAKDGISATFGRVKKDDGTPLLHVFSSNAYPFEDGKNYTPFAIFTLLEKDGDYKAAAKELSQDGFGDQRDMAKDKPTELTKSIKEKFESKVEVEVEERKKGKKSPITEAKEYLSQGWDFRINVINNVCESRRIGESKWTQINENDIWSEINEYGIKMSKDNVKSILGSSFVPEYNAFKEYFNKLYSWDGIDYFHEVTKFMDIDDPAFFEKMLEKQFVRAIKCALDDDYYNRMVFVLQSKNQEIGKSRFIHYLNPFGKLYFSEQPLSDNKDKQIALAETFIYNLEELDEMKSNRISSIKAILAKSMILERRPYGSQNIAMPRRCTFFASTNYSEFLTDDTNTRWIIFRVDAINDELFASVNKTDLWAQAWALYNDPTYEYELTPEEKVTREERNKTFRESSVEEGIIAQYFKPSETNFVYVSDIIKKLVLYAGPGVRINQSTSAISQQLDGLGFKYKEEELYNIKFKKYGIETKN